LIAGQYAVKMAMALVGIPLIYAVKMRRAPAVVG
jgi:hypothetical protein